MYICILGRKKLIQGRGKFSTGGGGGFGLKQLSMLDTLRNRWTRGRKGPCPLSYTIHVCILPKIILGMKQWQYTSMLDCRNQLHI